MNDIQIVEYNKIRVVTTKQVAEAYGATPKQVSNNFNANKKRYTEGKHYFVLEGEEKRQFINRPEFQDSSIKAKRMYLWTQRGALLLAKSINTDVAWEAYERLVDFYFEKKEEKQISANIEVFVEEPKKITYNTSSTPVPKNPNWYERNRRRMNALCERSNVSLSYLYHCILKRIGEEYDIDAANRIYEKEKGYHPKYQMDIVSYFPELGILADEFLEKIEKL